MSYFSSRVTLFCDDVLPCSPGWPGINHADPAGLKLVVVLLPACQPAEQCQHTQHCFICMHLRVSLSFVCSICMSLQAPLSTSAGVEARSRYRLFSSKATTWFPETGTARVNGRKSGTTSTAQLLPVCGSVCSTGSQLSASFPWYSYNLPTSPDFKKSTEMIQNSKSIALTKRQWTLKILYHFFSFPAKREKKNK